MFLLNTTDFVPPLASKTAFSRKERLSDGWNSGDFRTLIGGGFIEGWVLLEGSPDWQLRPIHKKLKVNNQGVRRLFIMFLGD
jgi:hypothetical protein